MILARLPSDEAERLSTLVESRLCLRPVGQHAKVVTQLAASLLERPSAAFSLITADRQVFRPGVGLTMAGTPRSISFCAHAILRPNEPMIVEDARQDERFADNPLVSGEHGFRFYAGMPVRAANGQPLGALCVLDNVPGSLSAAQRNLLRGLAGELESVIQRGRPLLRQRDALLQELRHAVSAEAFSLQWQPIARADNLHLSGYEALIRWTKPDGHAVPPDVFIPLAERSGLISRIDAFVIQTACAEAVLWGGAHRVSVNVSARWFSLSKPMLPKLVARALAQTGLVPSRLVIEVTERMLIADPKRALREIQELNALGVQIALDDFGTGYSSLGYLEAFPFRTVKLDKTFVRGLGRNRRAEAVARAVVRLGHDLGMTICAEGVETQHQLAFLQQERCDFVQGWLIGRPGSGGSAPIEAA